MGGYALLRASTWEREQAYRGVARAFPSSESKGNATGGGWGKSERFLNTNTQGYIYTKNNNYLCRRIC